jgi:hypothetical protein
MATDRQIAANRANAQRSTGPVTTAGRKVSRYNALKHGLTANSVLIQGEDLEQFNELRQRLHAEYLPQSAVEEYKVEMLAYSLVRLRRIPALESAAFNFFGTDYLDLQVLSPGLFNLNGPAIPNDGADQINDLPNGYALMKLMQSGDFLSKLDRHEAQLLRQVNQLTMDLEDIRAKRAKDAR